MGLKELIFGKQIKQAHAAQYYNSTRTGYKNHGEQHPAYR